MKKIIAIVVALAMIMALAVPAFAADEHNAYFGIADADWYPSSFTTDPADCVVTGDGQYVIESDAFAGASGLVVFVIDIVGLKAEHPDATAVVDSIEIDGSALEFDASKVKVGDTEDNGNLRIEFYNEYGPTASDPAVNKDTFAIGTTIKVTFTVSGVGGEAAPADDAVVGDGTAEDNNTVEPETATSSNEDTTPAPAETTAAPSTGLALAVVPAIVAMAAAVVSKKH